ncbi:hypothetical protein AYO49_05435 [Verrucomicrobiaceae bacterium SCGC AG-212-N21]|nr:hypothetical protein AYO49_05435 [Verrucomicrobiaceae bacterium SCGC AG-212-N21]
MTIDPFSTDFAESEVDSADAVARFIHAAKLIREWQEAQLPKMSDNGLLARFGKFLGSTKTFKRALTGDVSELRDVESKWLPQYEEVVRLIEADRNTTAEPMYKDLPFLKPILADATRLMGAVGNRRLMMIEGDTGHGKSVALRAIKEKFGDRAVLCEADESWFRAAAALGALSLATGAVSKATALARQLNDRQNQLIEHIRPRRLVIIDEFQHSGGRTLNALKTLINRTDSVFIVAGMRTLMQKLSTANQEEARQLTHNRLFARHVLTGPGIEDAKIFFERRLGVDLKDKQILDAISALIVHRNGGGGRPELVAAHLGGMAFLRNVADTVKDLIGTDKVDAKTLMEAANHVKKQATGW